MYRRLNKSLHKNLSCNFFFMNQIPPYAMIVFLTIFISNQMDLLIRWTFEDLRWQFIHYNSFRFSLKKLDSVNSKQTRTACIVSFFDPTTRCEHTLAFLDILKNLGNQTILVTIDLTWLALYGQKHTKETNITQNIRILCSAEQSKS